MYMLSRSAGLLYFEIVRALLFLSNETVITQLKNRALLLENTFYRNCFFW